MPSLPLLAALVAVTLSPIPVPRATASYAADPAPRAHRVTLITGDVVTYTDGVDPVVAVEQATRREPVVFLTTRDRGGFYVTPSDVDLGAVDKELFNVKSLIDQGFGDDRDKTLPLIVTGGAARNLPKGRPLPSVDGVAVRVDKSDAARFLSMRAAARIWLDRRLRVNLDRSVPQVGAPQAWQAGYDGTGVTVAVLDTGIDADHPDVAGKVVEARSFVEGDESPADLHGHGTHVASTIAGNGAASQGRFRGVAPGAKLAVGKVCAFDECPESAILEGMDWAAHSGARVVNMSIGGPPTDGTDLLSRRVDELTAETGTLFVIAAGNSSCAPCVGSPGAAGAALTVGAVDGSDVLAEFSSRGPRYGDGAVKPEIVAPGVAITAARAAGTLPGYPGGEHYATLSGTSMATPHVAGAAAILAQARPAAAAGQLKDALASTAKDVGKIWYEQGSGRLDIPAALRQVSASAAVNLGRRNTGTATYTNDGDTPVTLDLSLTAKGWDGSATDAVRLSGNRVTVPAHEKASVEITVDGSPPGLFGGTLTAAFGDKTVRTPVSWYRPYEARPRHPLTITMIDRTGRPIPDRFPYVFRDRPTSDETPNDPFAPPESMFFAEQTAPGIWTAEVPPGSYMVIATRSENTPVVRRQTLLTATNVEIAGPAGVTLDERKAVRATAVTPEPTYRYNHQLTASVQSAGGSGLLTVLSNGSVQDADLYALPTAAPKRGVLGIAETYTLGQQTVRIGGLQPEYDPYQVAKALPGRRTLDVVYAGDGSDFTGFDVAGKAALVKLAMPPEGSGLPWSYLVSKAADDAAKKALAAGAAALVPYLDVPGARPVLPLTIGPRATPLPVLGIRNADGERLRGRPGAVLTVDVRPNPKYLYSLHFAPPFGVPGNLTHRVRPDQLTRTNSRYHADVPGLALYAWTLAFERDRGGTYVSASVYLQAPAQVDSYLGGATGNQFWRRDARLTNGVHQFPQLDFQPYRGPTETWFAGPLTMVAPDQEGLPGFYRDAGDRLFASPYLGDSSRGHFINVDFGNVYPFTYRLFRGDVEIPPRTFFSNTPYWELPREAAEYRLQGTFTLPGSGVYGPTDKVRTMSPKVRNEWIFRSGPGDEIPPLLQLRYHLGTDLTNKASAGRPHAIGLTAENTQGATLAYSTDEGATWREARVVRLHAGRYLAVLAHPATPGAAVWLRTEAWDAAGNRVTQTVQRAYQLISADRAPLPR